MIRLYSLCVISRDAIMLLAYSEIGDETNLHLKTMRDDINGTDFQKNRMGDYLLADKNNLQHYIFSNL
jgi:hypothetical protein